MSAKRDNLPGFMQTQAAFTAWIRNPDTASLPPNCDLKRMTIYRDLFYNNMEGMAARTFPVLKKLMGEDGWHRLFKEFFAEHLCQSPYFRDIPEEFFTWLQTQPVPDSRPWQLELAHYEWVELVLEVSDAEPPQQGDVFTSLPSLSPLALPLGYAWPVHRISLDWQPDTLPEVMTFLLVYRSAEGRVQFIELTPDVARLLQLISASESLTGDALLAQVATEFGDKSQPDNLRASLQQLSDKGIIGIK
jgi:hypothetical protein